MQKLRLSVFLLFSITCLALSSVQAGPLHHAAEKGDLAKVEQLIGEYWVNVNDNKGHMPLHYAAMRGHTAVAELLIAKGADIHAKARAGVTPLHYAAIMGHTAVTELLIAKGADIHAKAQADLTPLHMAAFKGYERVAELLIAKGADVDAKGESGATPLHSAAKKGHRDTADLLIAKGADVNARGNNAHTALHDAAGMGHTAVVKLLIERGADVNARKEDGETPRGTATRQRHRKVAKLLKRHGGKLVVSGASLPGNTGALPGLQQDTLRQLMMMDSLHDKDCKDRKVVNTEILKTNLRQKTVLERWTVDRCGKQVAYVIMFSPSPRGGTDILIRSPAAKRQSVSRPTQPNVPATGAYRVGIFPFGGPEKCHGQGKPLNRKVASVVHELIKQNGSLTVKYSYYDGAKNQPSIKKPDKLWSGSEPNVNLAYRLGQERGLDAIVMYWRPSKLWGTAYCTELMPPYPIKVYVIDVKQRKTYELKGDEENLRVMTKQAFSRFLAAHLSRPSPE